MRKKLVYDSRGMTFVELMASVSIMSIVSLGLIIILLAMSRQMVRDKYFNDMNVLANMILSQAEVNLANASDVSSGTNSGFTTSEELEFNLFSGINLGRTEETRFRVNGDYGILVTGNSGHKGFSSRWPPVEIDPNVYHNNGVKRVIEIKEFRIRNYQRRLFVTPKVAQNLHEVILVLKYQERDTDFSYEQRFSRVIFAPNALTLSNRLQSVAAAGGA